MSDTLLDSGDSLVRYIYHGSYGNLVHTYFLFWIARFCHGQIHSVLVDLQEVCS